jgi:hypothetical protein
MFQTNVLPPFFLILEAVCPSEMLVTVSQTRPTPVHNPEDLITNLHPRENHRSHIIIQINTDFVYMFIGT